MPLAWLTALRQRWKLPDSCGAVIIVGVKICWEKDIFVGEGCCLFADLSAFKAHVAAIGGRSRSAGGAGLGLALLVIFIKYQEYAAVCVD